MTGFFSTIAVVSCIASTASAFTPTSHTSSVRQSAADVSVKESFGFDFAEDQAENTPIAILGEERYKQYITNISDNSFLNRQYNILGRVRELDLLAKTADAQILSRLEKNGIDLVALEGALPLLDDLGLLSTAGNSQQILINGVAPLLVETAPIIIPALGGALEIGPPAFFLAALATGGLEYFFISNGVQIPFVGLDCGFYLGLLLVPLTAVFAGLGVGLANANSRK